MFDVVAKTSHPAEWTNVWTALGAIATWALFVGVFVQIRAARKDRRGWETLATCERYESDPILDQCSRTLRAARLSGDIDLHPELYKLDALTILNYLDGIAIGIDLGHYDGKIVQREMKDIVNALIDIYLVSDLAVRMEIYPDSFAALLALRKKWGR